MVQEILDFRITVFIKDKSGNIKELSKKVSLKIDWKTDRGGTRGLLNPEWKKYIRLDGKHDPKMDRWGGKGEVIQFEKDGKKYDIWVNFIVKRGWFRDRIIEEKFEFFPYDYSHGKQPDAPFTCGTGYDREVKGQMRHKVIPTKERKEGPVGVIVLVVIITFILLLILFAWERKQRVQET